MSNMEAYKKVFMDVFGVEESALGDGFTSDSEVKWDSVTQMTLITALEDQFDIMIEIDDIYELTSYAKGMEIVSKYGVKF